MDEAARAALVIAMLSFAVRSLVKERVRLGISVGGVAFAVMLIVLLRGLFVAYQTRVSDLYEGIGADVWVVQTGTADFFHSFSLLDRDLENEVEAVDGVASVRPYIARQVAFSLGGREVLLNLVGFDPADPVGGPSRIVEGTADLSADGIVVDRVFARQEDVGLGDVLTINSVPLRIEGISTGGDLVMFQYAYTPIATARSVLELPAADNAFLVTLDPGVTAGAVSEDIAAVGPMLSVRTTERVIEDNQRPITESFLPVIQVLLLLGFLVGVAVVGLTIYSAVLEKRREYGVIKAVGARFHQMVYAVSVQALCSATAGYIVGVALAVLASRAAEQWVPQFITQIELGDIGWIAVATLAMAVVASIVPLLRIARIDPAEVFRS